MHGTRPLLFMFDSEEEKQWGEVGVKARSKVDISVDD